MTGQTMSIIVFVSGTIALPNEERPLKFSQVRPLRQHARCARVLAQVRVDARSDVCGQTQLGRARIGGVVPPAHRLLCQRVVEDGGANVPAPAWVQADALPHART